MYVLCAYVWHISYVCVTGMVHVYMCGMHVCACVELCSMYGVSVVYVCYMWKWYLCAVQ